LDHEKGGAGRNCKGGRWHWHWQLGREEFRRIIGQEIVGTFGGFGWNEGSAVIVLILSWNEEKSKPSIILISKSHAKKFMRKHQEAQSPED
jgi:hypothetical protein